MDGLPILKVKSLHLLNLDNHLAPIGIDGHRVLNVNNHQVLVQDDRSATIGMDDY